FKSAMRARLIRISSCTPSAKKAFSACLLRLLKGSTAMLFGERPLTRLLSQIFHPTVAARAISDAINAAMAGFRRTHFPAYVKNPLRFALIGSCFNQWSRSSESARAEEERRFGSFSRHFMQIVESSRFILGFNDRGGRGSVSITNLIVS